MTTADMYRAEWVVLAQIDEPGNPWAIGVRITEPLSAIMAIVPGTREEAEMLCVDHNAWVQP